MNMIYDIYAEQIKEDCNSFNDFKTISWCGKWIPREKSAYGWIVPFIMGKLFMFFSGIFIAQYAIRPMTTNEIQLTNQLPTIKI